MIEFKLPAIGEGVVEGEIVRWLKQPGEAVDANEAIVEVMTDKATVEIPAPQRAVVKEHKAAEGDICAVGQVLAVLEAGAPGSATVSPPAAAAPSRAAAPSPAVASPAAAPASPSFRPETRAVAAPQASTPSATNTASNGTSRILATPAARALARETGIDLTVVPGHAGRITKADVERARDQGPVGPDRSTPHTAPAVATRAVPAGQTQPDEYIPFRGMRRRIAESMTRAYTTAVHYTYVEEIDVGRLVAIREQAKKAAAEEGVRLNYLPFIVKATVHALKKFPIVNAELDQEQGRIVLKKRYSIGIATATPNGLLVPVVHDADRLSLLDLSREIARVSEGARTGTAPREDLTGSTFTITSLGQIGGVLATPILNYPEVGIIGVHAMRKVPVVDENDAIVVGHRMNLSISLDHRVVDGYEGASFLQEVRKYLEDPTLLLLAGI